jgi:kynurenine formamidase
VSFVVPSLAAPQVHDLSLLVSPGLPCVWPVGMMQHSVTANRTFGPGAYYRDLIAIDEHTGTQWDAPAHFVPPPDSGLPGAGPMGLITSEKVPAWQFCGEACVIDVSGHRDDATNGASFLIRPEMVQAWEKNHRPLKFGDAVLFRSGYSDRYYQPFPRGERFVQTALRKETPGWPAPTPETMQYLGGRGVKMLGLDGASMGPLPDLAVATHQAGGKLGMIWTECLTGLGPLPPTGAFHAFLPAKHAGGSGGECRAIAITEPKLAARLIESARHKRVVDLSVTLDEDLPITWPGYGPGDEAPRYIAKTSDKHFAPLPDQPNLDRLMAAPLAGKAEGWPAPTAEAIVFLAQKGVRCVGTDGPTLGGVNPRQAMMVYWAAASRGVFPVEYLTNLGQLPASGAYFILAPIKVQGAHGGYGRALALH